MIFLSSRLLKKDHHEEAHHAADFLAAVDLGEFVDLKQAAPKTGFLGDAKQLGAFLGGDDVGGVENVVADHADAGQLAGQRVHDLGERFFLPDGGVMIFSGIIQ